MKLCDLLATYSGYLELHDSSGRLVFCGDDIELSELSAYNRVYKGKYVTELEACGKDAITIRLD